MSSNFDPIEAPGGGTSNPHGSANLPRNPQRRSLMLGGAASALTAMFCATPVPGRAATQAATRTATRASRIGFESVAVSSADAVVVPRGYRTQVLYSWGDATGIAGLDAAVPALAPANSALDQTLQAGMHHDGVHYFPFGKDKINGGNRGLLVVNHEYTDDGLLHTDGMKTWTAEKVRKAQAAHGVSVAEIERLPDGD